MTLSRTLTRTVLAGHVSVGYYAGYDPHNRARFTKVHAHIQGKGPACGARTAAYMRYQWCSHNAVRYIECERCKALVR